MTQEEKQLLLKDLCARLPYKVKIQIDGITEELCEIDGSFVNHSDWRVEEIKPYLRPMSSMTKEEFYNSPIYGNDVAHSYKIDKVGFHFIRIETYDNEVLDWLNSHHFDYRGLIEKGIALEAPEGMYES